MLTKLLPDQISKLWPIIKYAVEESLPPIVGEHPDKMNRILSAVLRGSLEVWVSYQHPDNKFEAVVVTQILYDDASNVYNLLIYCLYGYSTITKESWAEGYETLNKYAKAKNCNSIIAYTNEPHIVNMAKKFEGMTSFTFISIKIV